MHDDVNNNNELNMLVQDFHTIQTEVLNFTNLIDKRNSLYNSATNENWCNMFVWDFQSQNDAISIKAGLKAIQNNLKLCSLSTDKCHLADEHLSPLPDIKIVDP